MTRFLIAATLLATPALAQPKPATGGQHCIIVILPNGNMSVRCIL